MQLKEHARASSTTTACASRTMKMSGPARIASARCTRGCRNSAPCSARSSVGSASTTSSAGQPWRRAGTDQREWGWNRPPYFERVGEEHRATRERAAYSTSRRLARSKSAALARLPLLQRVADGDMDKPVGVRHILPVPQYPGRRRGRSHRHAARQGAVPGGHGLGFHRQRPGLAPNASSARGWPCRRFATSQWTGRASPSGARRHAACLQKITKSDVSNELISVSACGRDRCQRRRGLGAARQLRWRTGLGALCHPRIALNLSGMRSMAAGAEFGIEVGGYKVLDFASPRERVSLLHGRRHAAGDPVRGWPGILRQP